MDKLSQAIIAARERWRVAEAEQRLAETVLASTVETAQGPVSVVFLLKRKVASLAEATDLAYLQYVQALQNVQEILRDRSGTYNH